MKRISGEVCSLVDIKVNQKCKILEINIENKEIKRHLLEMGLVKGTIVKIKKVAPLGEPVVIELRGYELFLQKKELRKIKVQVA